MVRVVFTEGANYVGEYPEAILDKTVFNHKTGMVELRNQESAVVAFVPFSKIRLMDSKK